MYSPKIRLLSLNLILVMLLTLMPVQAVEDTGTGPDEDKKTEYTVTLDGNDGALNGEEKMVVTYSAEKPLNLRDYPFTRAGYALVGWAEDATGTTRMFGRDSFLSSQIGSGVLYAVWLKVPESGNYAIFDTCGWGEIPDPFSRVGTLCCVELTDDFKMPVLQKSSTAPEASLWLWRNAEKWDFYYEGEAFVPKIGMQFRMELVSGEDGSHWVILDGNGGTETLYDENGACAANKYRFHFSDSITLHTPRFQRPGYILKGFNTKQDGTGTAYPADNFTITSDVAPVQILYAQWSPLDLLKDGVRLIIDGDDMTGLLGKNGASYGAGWRFIDNGGNGTARGEIEIQDSRYGGGSIAFDGDLMLNCSGGASVGRIEAAGSLDLSAWNDGVLSVKASGVPALRATSVSMGNPNVSYNIEAENAVAVDAARLWLSSPNVTIKGDPAVCEGAMIDCGKGIGCTISEDRTTLTTYAIEQKITLNGNGGTLNGEEEMVVTYSAANPLNLRDYPFAREGYALVGWSEDATGTTRMFGRDSFLSSQIGSGVLYAVWLEVPESGSYAIFDTNGWGELPNAFSHAGNLWCVELTDDFKMPTLQKNSTAADADLWFWRNNSLICYEGEAYTPDSGMEFYISPVVGKNGYHQTIFDGNGGTGTTRAGDGTRYVVNKYGPFNYRDGDTVAGQTFRRPGYILTSFNTKQDGTGTAYPTRNIKITANMDPVQILYAQWSPLNLLKDGVRLIIDDDDMTGLLGINGWSDGAGWRFGDNGGNGTADGQIVISDSTRYSGGSIAFDGNLSLNCVNGTSVSRVEAAGRLNLFAWDGARLSVKANGVPALRAMDVNMNNPNASYDIEAENAVAVDAATLWLNSPNVTIKGDPAVREGAVIDCMEGIGYTRSEDKKTLTTYAIDQTITLVGNGGTLDGKEKMDVTYSAENPFNLRDYPFAREGHVLVGWAADQEGTKLVTDATGHLKQLVDATLYAVWLDVPDSNYVILQGSYDGAHATKAGFSSIAMAADGTVTLPEPNNPKSGIAVWRKSDTNEPYFVGETVTVPSGTRFNCVLHYNANKILIFDGNGGTMRNTVNGVQCTVTRRMVTTAAGKTYYSRSQFVMDGYTMTGYNTKADGTGKSYPYDEILVTEDMDDQTILYAQWKQSDPSEETITIDGLSYTAKADHGGYNWVYYYDANIDHGSLSLKNYQGGSIASDIDLSVTSSGQSVVNGSISSKKSLWMNGLTTGSLIVTASEGSALIAEKRLVIQPNGKLSVTSENAPAVKVTGELYVNIDRNGFFEATGKPALSYGEMAKDGYQIYLIRGGTDKASAVPITDDTYNDKAYISYEMRDRVLTLHGNGGKTAAGVDTFTATSKDDTFDLGEYTNIFTNGGKRLLGWSKTENSATIDYAAASGTMYYFDWFYELTADLYAVWESDSQRGVVLKNYGYFDGDRYTYSEQYTAVAEGGTYTLPESSRAGYIFKDWLGSDGTTYAAGDTIKIPTALSFTAQYEVGKLTVGGVTYTANRVHGSDALGWMYYPDGYMNYDGRALLYLLGNYSGKPITLDGNLYLSLTNNIDLTGEEGSPLVSVTGDLHITAPKSDGITLTGGKNAPAIKVGGTLHLSAPVTLIGGEDAPAIEVGKLDAGYAFLAGASKETAERAGIYNNEHYVRMDLSDPVTFQPGDVAPDLPDTETYRFIGWSVTVDENNSRTTVWYRPGEKISGSEKTLSARYVPKDESIIFLDGNGAVTAHGVRYSDAIVHLPDQAGWRYMNADELKTMFQRDGFTLTGFVGPDPDSKTDKLYTLNDLDALSTVFDDGQLHEGKTTIIYTAQWERIGNKTEDSSAYYTKSDDGAVKIESVNQAALEEQLETGSTVQIDMSELKAEQVVLPAGAVSDVFALPKAEALSIKTPAAAVTLDKAAMQSVTEAAKGGSLRLRVRTGNELNPGQTAIIGDTEQSVVLDVGLTANGTEIHSFDGEVTVSVPFDWTKQGVLQAWYLADDGKTKEPVEVAYRDGTAVLMLNHFSTYAIVVKANDIDETIVSVAGNSVTVNAPAGAATCIAALYSADGRQMAVGKSEIAENMATVTWKSVDWTKVQTLKVFFLDGSGAPIKSSVKELIKV